jgi:hypothetical protein
MFTLVSLMQNPTDWYLGHEERLSDWNIWLLFHSLFPFNLNNIKNKYKLQQECNTFNQTLSSSPKEMTFRMMQVTIWWKSKCIGFLCFFQAWNIPLPIAMVSWFFQFFEVHQTWPDKLIGRGLIEVSPANHQVWTQNLLWSYDPRRGYMSEPSSLGS